MAMQAGQITQAEDALKSIMSGQTQKVITPEERKYKMIENGKRIPNIILRKAVDKMIAKKLPEKVIINRILFFDEMAEKGELLNYLKEQAKGKEKK
jgi:hypothetical protein